jgi:hypothetical protein
VRTLDDILTQLRALQPILRHRYPIRSMGIFNEGSDLDLLLELGDDIDLIG